MQTNILVFFLPILMTGPDDKFLARDRRALLDAGSYAPSEFRNG